MSTHPYYLSIHMHSCLVMATCLQLQLPWPRSHSPYPPTTPPKDWYHSPNPPSETFRPRHNSGPDALPRAEHSKQRHVHTRTAVGLSCSIGWSNARGDAKKPSVCASA